MSQEQKGLAYDFPLRPDFIAQIVIPRDLTRQEAERLAAFLYALAGLTGHITDIGAMLTEHEHDQRGD